VTFVFSANRGFAASSSLSLEREREDPVTLLYYHLHQLHREFSPEQMASQHHRTDSSETHLSRQPSPATSRQPAGSTTAHQDDDDPVLATYQALVSNPEFINRLVDVLRANPGGLRGPWGQPGAPGVAAEPWAELGHWQADEVGFFFPDLHSSYGSSEIVTIGKDSFYRNASVFLDRLDDIARLKGDDLVRNNISTCFRGAALQWYTTELSDIEKASFRSPSGSNPQDAIYRWRLALKRRWDPPPSVALQNFMNTRFTMTMVQSGVSVVQYFSTKLRLAKEAGFDNVHQQLLAVWNGLDISIREHIDEPDEDTSIDRFRRKLEDKGRLWREKLIQQRLRTQASASTPRWQCTPPPNPARSFSSPDNDGPIRSNERAFLPVAQYQSNNHQYQSNNRFSAQGRARVEQNRIAAPPQRLQISAGLSPSQDPQRHPTAWTPGRRACSKCGGNHIDWEHTYYQNNPRTSRPTKSYYLDTLQHRMTDYSQEDVAECIAAYNAAEDDETPTSSPRASGSSRSSSTLRPSPSPQTPPLSQYTEYEPEEHPVYYPSVGGSQWFDASEEDLYDVYNHHLVEEPSKAAIANPTSLGNHSQRSETVVADKPFPNPTPLGNHSQRSETVVAKMPSLHSAVLNPTPLGSHSQRSETEIVGQAEQTAESPPCRFPCRFP